MPFVDYSSGDLQPMNDTTFHAVPWLGRGYITDGLDRFKRSFIERRSFYSLPPLEHPPCDLVFASTYHISALVHYEHNTNNIQTIAEH